jgi:hypothetical protein
MNVTSTAQALSGTRVQQETTGRHSVYRAAGGCLVAGAVLTTVFNVLFPRAADPADTVAVLTVMAGNEVRHLISFLGVTAGLWLLTAGIAGIYRSLSAGPGAVWARFGFYGLLVGAAVFTVATGLGMATTRAAVDWVAAGSDPASAQYAIAAALNAADDGVWSLSIIAYWAALGVLGIGIIRGRIYPRWSGSAIVALGFANALLVGVPLAYGVVNQSMFLLFAGLAQLTIVWALATGIWMLRARQQNADE